MIDRIVLWMPALIFFDNAWEYNDGRSEEVVGQALKGKRDKAVMTKVCTHGRASPNSIGPSERPLCERLRPQYSHELYLALVALLRVLHNSPSVIRFQH